MKSPSKPASRLAGAVLKRWLPWLLVVSGNLFAELTPEPLAPPALITPGQRIDTTHGLLWQVESPTGASSYLFGTIHVAEPAILQLPSPVQAAFDEADQLVVEVVLTQGDYLEIAKRMRLNGSQRLPELVGESLYARVLHAAYGRDINQQLLRLKPWAVATLLVTPRPTGLSVLDQQLERAAVAAGKRVTGLESLDEQLAVFEQMSLDEQIDLLHEAVLATLEFEVYYGELLVAYMNRDLARLVQLSSLHLAQDSRLKKALQARLVDDRNQRMIERLLPVLQQGKAFIAVGALHLPGETGLLQGFYDHGYRVSLLY